MLKNGIIPIYSAKNLENVRITSTFVSQKETIMDFVFFRQVVMTYAFMNSDHNAAIRLTLIFAYSIADSPGSPGLQP